MVITALATGRISVHCSVIVEACISSHQCLFHLVLPSGEYLCVIRFDLRIPYCESLVFNTVYSRLSSVCSHGFVLLWWTVDERKLRMNFTFVLKNATSNSDFWRMNAKRWLSVCKYAQSLLLGATQCICMLLVYCSWQRDIWVPVSRHFGYVSGIKVSFIADSHIWVTEWTVWFAVPTCIIFTLLQVRKRTGTLKKWEINWWEIWAVLCVRWRPNWPGRIQASLCQVTIVMVYLRCQQIHHVLTGLLSSLYGNMQRWVCDMWCSCSMW